MLSSGNLVETSLDKLIGRTPLIRISYSYKEGLPQHIFVKCEQYNLTGSTRDRLVLHSLKQSGLEPGELVTAAVNGHTAVSLAAVGRALGYRVALRTAALDPAIREAVKAYGAVLDEAADPDLLLTDAVRLHLTETGPELIRQLASLRVPPAAFIAGCHTGAMLMGTGQALKKQWPGMSLHPVERAGSAPVPELLDLSLMERVIRVDEGDAVLAKNLLAKKLDLAVGVSSGANLLGAIKVQQRLKFTSSVLTIFPGSGKYETERLPLVTDGYLTPHIELLNYKTV